MTLITLYAVKYNTKESIKLIEKEGKRDAKGTRRKPKGNMKSENLDKERRERLPKNHLRHTGEKKKGLNVNCRGAGNRVKSSGSNDKEMVCLLLNVALFILVLTIYRMCILLFLFPTL